MTAKAKQLSFFDIPGFDGGQGQSAVQQELFSKEELEKLRKPKEVKSISVMRRLRAQWLNVKVKDEMDCMGK